MHARWWRLGIGALTAAHIIWPGIANAMEWSLAPLKSHIGFEYVRNGNPAEGVFTRFTGEGSFAPSAPEAATLELRIESASIDLGERLASAFATSVEWFDSANFPLVIYRLTRLTSLGGENFNAKGTLTIRGKTRPIEATVTLRIDAQGARAQGVLRLDRRDFGLGVGPSALFVEIGSPVAVRFDLMAAPAR